VLTPFVALAQSQAYVDPDIGITFFGITDPVHKVTHGYTLPPAGASNSDEFIGEIVAPIAEKWVGLAPGGGMINNLLIVAWPSGSSVVASLRMAS
jgi:cellobiose dehydrogenase (acceptor)